MITNPLSLFNSNDHPSGDRMEYLGHSKDERLLYVVSVEKTTEEIRIISARKATSHERREYEKGI